jgi:SAM-dependent methyltransferase
VNPDPDASATFDETALQAGLDINEGSSNYLDWIVALCAPSLGPRVLEIGAGHGYLTERFADGRDVVATDISATCLARLHERFDATPNVDVRELDLASTAPEREAYDTEVLVNVLEHIEDDGHALDVLRDSLRSGGRVVLYVPAFMWLYSPWDRKIGHYRRYRKRALTTMLSEHGFDVVDARYVNAIGALGWFVYCRLLRRDAAEGSVAGSFDRFVVPVARRLETAVHPPFGLSLLCVGEKR